MTKEEYIDELKLHGTRELAEEVCRLEEVIKGMDEFLNNLILEIENMSANDLHQQVEKDGYIALMETIKNKFIEFKSKEFKYE